MAADHPFVTVLDLVRYATTRFGRAALSFGHGTGEAFDEAVFLVGEALGLPHGEVELFYPARIAADERRRVLALIEARVVSRRPAPYLVRRAYMHGVPFYVDERVLIPRSYLGELLTGEALGDAGLLDEAAVRRVLDLGTGCGALAILAALRFADAQVDATDISAPALEVAARNVADHGVEHRVSLLQGDLFAPLGGRRYDLILANPPYVDAEAMAALPPEYRHEPASALAGGGDGLEIVARLIAGAGAQLAPGGGLLCEIGRGRAALEARFPELPFLWLDTETSVGEVFWLDAGALGE
jgi:ribosomal protein L3 glutamine methyltransferase